jgi:hypothetical protein
MARSAMKECCKGKPFLFMKLQLQSSWTFFANFLAFILITSFSDLHSNLCCFFNAWNGPTRYQYIYLFKGIWISFLLQSTITKYVYGVFNVNTSKIRMLQFCNDMGVITIKWVNNDKGFNHKWALCEHFDFFIERNFWRTFFATCSLKYL